MSYAVMPLDDYVSTCDKVREKVDLTTIRFEDTDFGFIRSAIFTAKESGEHIFTIEVNDESKLDINAIIFAGPEWENNSPPGYFNIIDEKTLSAKFGNNTSTRIFISDSKGLKASDIISVTLSYNGEVVENFVAPPKIKSGELADKVDEVYEAGRNDFGFKGSAEGNPATLKYVHPKEHKVEIKTNANQKVYIRGKNLLNLEGREVVNFGAGEATTKRTFFNEKAIILGLASNNYCYNVTGDFEITQNTISCLQTATSYGIGFDVKLLPNTTYRFSSEERIGETVRLVEYDAEGNFIRNSFITNASATTTDRVAWGVVLFVNQTSGSEHYIVNPQLEYGSVITEYEPPIAETEYVAGADGTVEVKSISPTMNITTEEGVIVSAECFKDAEKEIESLTTAIALTGGN